jgi:co-chaperonin GroES (HSP10)
MGKTENNPEIKKGMKLVASENSNKVIDTGKIASTIDELPIVPIGNKIFIQELKSVKESKLILDDSMKAELLPYFKVIGVGNSVINVKVGDIIYAFGDFKFHKLPVLNYEFGEMYESQVMGIVKEEFLNKIK